MAFPTIETTSNNTTAAGANHAITLPSGIQAGDLLLLFFATDGDNTITSWDSFTELGQQSSGTANFFAIGYRIATGSDACTLTVSVTNEPGSHVVYRISGHDSGQIPQLSTVAGAAGTQPDPTIVTPTGGAKDYLWIHACGWDRNRTVTAWNANFTLNRVYVSGGGSGDCSVGISGRNENVASKDPTYITISASDTWIAWTVAVHPEAGALSNRFSRQVERTIQLDNRFSRQVERTVILTNRFSRQVERSVALINRLSRQVERTVQEDSRFSRQAERTVQEDDKFSRQVERTVMLEERFDRQVERTVQIPGRFSRQVERTLYLINRFSRQTERTVMIFDRFSRQVEREVTLPLDRFSRQVERTVQADNRFSRQVERTIQVFERFGRQVERTLYLVGRFSRQVERTVQEDSRFSREVERTIRVSDKFSRQVERSIEISDRFSRQVERTVRAYGHFNRQVERTVQLDNRFSRQVERTLYLINRFSRQAEKTVQLSNRFSRQVERNIILVNRFSRQVERTLYLVNRFSRQVERTVLVSDRLGRQVERTIILVGRFSRQVERTIIVSDRFSRQVERTLYLVGYFSRQAERTVQVSDRFSRQVERTLLLVGRFSRQTERLVQAYGRFSRQLERDVLLFYAERFSRIVERTIIVPGYFSRIVARSVYTGQPTMVRGYVVDDNTSLPLNDVEIRIYGYDWRSITWTKTNNDGYFEFFVDGGENYHIRFELDQYFATIMEELVPVQPNTPYDMVTIRARPEYLGPGTGSETVTEILVDRDAYPIEGATVDAFIEGDMETLMARFVTSVDGRFTFFLDPETYIIKCRHGDSLRYLRVIVTLGSTDFTFEDITTTYVPPPPISPELGRGVGTEHLTDYVQDTENNRLKFVHVLVKVLGTDEWIAEDWTNENGEFHFYLDVGSYNFFFSGADFTDISARGDVTSPDTLTWT